MNKRLFVWLFALVVMGILALAAINVRADDDKPISTQEVVPVEIGGSGYFAFTGARTSAQIATVVHCTNPAPTTLQLLVNIFQWDGNSSYPGYMNIPAGQTHTISFDTGGNGTGLYAEDYTIDTTTSIGQGRGVIIPQVPDAPFYCTVQVLDKVAAIPSFVVDLPVIAVDANGFPIPPGLLRTNFLPSVLDD